MESRHFDSDFCVFDSRAPPLEGSGLIFSKPDLEHEKRGSEVKTRHRRMSSLQTFFSGVSPCGVHSVIFKMFVPMYSCFSDSRPIGSMEFQIVAVL